MILFLDDEERRLSSHVMELRISGYEVNFFKDVSEAFNFFEANIDTIELLILDIMMPPSVVFQAEDTDEGLRTGVRFFEKVRLKARETPVLFFSNVTDPVLHQKLRKEKNCWFVSKNTCYPSDLGKKVNEILSTVQDNKRKK